MEDLIYHGGAIKALGNGRVGGFLVLFSSEDAPDLDGEFFTKSTEFFVEDGSRLPVLYDHGFDPILKRRKLGVASVETQDAGLWLEAQLNLRDEYEKAVYELVEKGKAGWSSGAAGHLSQKKPGKKATEIIEWGIAEASITVRPADFNNRVIPIKSYKHVNLDEAISQPSDDAQTDKPIVAPNTLAQALTKHVEDRIDDGHDRESIIKSLSRESGLDVEQVESILTGECNASVPNLKAFARALNVSFDALQSAKQRDYAKTIKGMFAEALADQTPSRWQLDSIYSDIVRKLATTAQASVVTGVDFDVAAKIKEATGEYMERLEKLAIAQVGEYVESGSDEPFYLKAIINTSEGLETDHLDLEQHSEVVASANAGILKRFRRFYETRLKAGRVLSEKTRQRIRTVRDSMAQAVSDCDALLDESQPMASDAEKSAGQMEHLRLQHIELTQRINHHIGV